jgi:hypothetical protein
MRGGALAAHGSLLANPFFSVAAFTHTSADIGIDGKSKMGSSFSDSQWLCCSLFAPIDHSPP